MFRDTGQHSIKLLVEDVYGCIDSTSEMVIIESNETYFLPTAFTPNSDGINDVYIGVGQINFAKDFKMEIFDRWGEKIFQSTNPTIGWDGRKKSNDILPQGVFTCKVKFKNSRDETINLVKPFLLIR